MAEPKNNNNGEKTKKNKTVPASAGKGRGKRMAYKTGGNREANKLRHILNTANPNRMAEAKQWAANRSVVGIFEKVLRTKNFASMKYYIIRLKLNTEKSLPNLMVGHPLL